MLVQIPLNAREIDIDNLIQKAKISNKHLFVFLHKTDCGYCDSMIEFTLDDEKVKEIVEKKFLFVHININENDNVTYKNFKGGGKEFAKHVGYNFYPTSLFFDDEKDISYAVPGYRDEKIFNVILNYVDSKSYKKISFRKYAQQFDFNKKL
jgi:thioredoxin-related protein